MYKNSSCRNLIFRPFSTLSNNRAAAMIDISSFLMYQHRFCFLGLVLLLFFAGSLELFRTMQKQNYAFVLKMTWGGELHAVGFPLFWFILKLTIKNYYQLTVKIDIRQYSGNWIFSTTYQFMETGRTTPPHLALWGKILLSVTYQ